MQQGMGGSPYAALLGAMAQKPPGPPPGGGPSPLPSPVGAPPPTMLGPMQTGDVASAHRAALSSAIMALREVKNRYPSAMQSIDGMIAELQSMHKPGGAPGLGGLGGGMSSSGPSPAGDDSPLAPPPL